MTGVNACSATGSASTPKSVRSGRRSPAASMVPEVSRGAARVADMCRNIRPLHNYDPPTQPEEVRGAALQYVRKISGMNKPARVNQEAFDRAVDAVAEASSALLRDLVATAPPRDRAREIERARERSIKRFGERATA